MITMNLNIQNLDALRSRVSSSPKVALRYLGKATEAALFEVEKQAVDRNFRFKTPRALRTGALERSFKFGRSISPDRLSGSIGPTARYRGFYYPAAVYFGTRRGIKPNKYMDRIAKEAEPDVSKHFERAVELFVNEIAS